MKQQLIRFPCDCGQSSRVPHNEPPVSLMTLTMIVHTVYHHKCVGKAGGLVLRKT